MSDTIDAQTRVDELLFLIGHLIEILELENKALAQGAIHLVSDLIDQKVKLSRAYELRMLGMEQAGQSFAETDHSQLVLLNEQNIRLQDLIVVNAKELKINIDTSRKFMSVISESVKDTAPKTQAYGSNGVSGHNAHGKNAVQASIAINETL